MIYYKQNYSRWKYLKPSVAASGDVMVNKLN